MSDKMDDQTDERRPQHQTRTAQPPIAHLLAHVAFGHLLADGLHEAQLCQGAVRPLEIWTPSASAAMDDRVVLVSTNPPQQTATTSFPRLAALSSLFRGFGDHHTLSSSSPVDLPRGRNLTMALRSSSMTRIHGTTPTTKGPLCHQPRADLVDDRLRLLCSQGDEHSHLLLAAVTLAREFK
jgi:hypothetical protein